MIKMNRVYAYNTHYKILDYNLGDFKALENELTYHDRDLFKHEPRFFYDKSEKVLYVPRGINKSVLENWNGKSVTIVENKTKITPIRFEMKNPPRDDLQRKAIRFLTGKDEFRSTYSDSQKVLVMEPGTGKTYCAINTIQQYGYRTMVIVKSNTLKEQWLKKFEEFTSMGGVNIVDITSSKHLYEMYVNGTSDNNFVFIVTRDLLIYYMKKYGMDILEETMNELGIGIKIFDEAHQEYKMTLLIDYFTNVKYTFYLTATFQLSDYKDDRVFQSAYNSVRKLQIREDNMLRHVIYIPVLFNSHPTDLDILKIEHGRKGFNKFAYIDYELDNCILEKHILSVLSFFKIENSMDGKTLLLSSKKSSCDFFSELVLDYLDNQFNTCAFYTGHKVENYKSYDIICATSSMLGTGEDIPDLRFVLNTEPGRSLVITEQVSGRLRPYHNGQEDTYYIEFIDTGFQTLVKWYHTRMKLLKQKVKSIKELNLEV